MSKPGLRKGAVENLNQRLGRESETPENSTLQGLDTN
jgi:hypothetical protein